MVRFTSAERRVFAAKEQATVSQHAERHRIVTRGPWQGPWRNENVPYLVTPMDMFALPWVRRMYLCFAPQTGKTQIAFNCLNYVIDQDPDAAFYVMSDEGRAKRISRRQILPMLRAHQRTSQLLSANMDDTSTLAVQFTNGMDLMLAWASSVSALASESARYMFFDEVDKYHPRINLDLGDQRTNAYPHTSKQMYYTTPEDEFAPITQKIRNEADVLYLLLVACPLCGQYQIMEFDSIRWPSDIRDPRKIEKGRLARYVCTSCERGWDDSLRDMAVKACRWMPHRPDRDWPDNDPAPIPEDEAAALRAQNIAFHLPSWYSPFISLSDVAGAFLRGLADPEKLQIFVTQHKAHPWKNTVVSTTEERVMKAKVPTLPPQIVPDAAIALTCGVDVQKSGCWFAVRAWGRDYTSWLIHYGFVSYWSEIEDILYNSVYPRQNNAAPGLRVWRAGFDTGGGKYQEDASSAEDVYFWIIRNRGRGVSIWPTKGSSTPLATKISIGSPLERTPSGKSIPGGIQIIRLDTDKLKDLYHWRIEQAVETMAAGASGSMAAYLHSGTGRDYARQIMAEKKERLKNGKEKYVQIYRDNHLLDCEVIAHALADPEWPGGGVHMVIPRIDAGQVTVDPDATETPVARRLSTGYQRPDWLNR